MIQHSSLPPRYRNPSSPPPPSPLTTFLEQCLAKVCVPVIVQKLSMTLEFFSPLSTVPEFISHCFLCRGIYDVTANISFVLR